jgi:hypothetical protein
LIVSGRYPFVFRLGIELVKLLQSRRYIESSNPLFANNVQNQNRVNTALGATSKRHSGEVGQEEMACTHKEVEYIQ